MRTALALAPWLLLPALAVACSTGESWDIDRVGERCESLDLAAGADGRVRVGDASFVPPGDSRAVSCFDEDGWLSVNFGENHGEERHTLAAHFGVLQLDAETAALVTPENRQDMLWALAAECVARNRADPRCLEFDATPNDFSLPGLTCAGWDETWLDIGVPRAIGEEWPARARSALCFDSAEPPAAIALIAWSERHAPDIDGLADEEVERQSLSVLSSLQFEPAQAPDRPDR
jgi:hypothetical protein